MGFEEYLLNKGYVKMVYDTKLGVLKIPGKYDIISTMGYLDFRYVKDGYKTISYGLYEADKPPVWFAPKPISLCATEKGVWIGNDILNKIYQKYTNDEIYESLNQTYEFH